MFWSDGILVPSSIQKNPVFEGLVWTLAVFWNEGGGKGYLEVSKNSSKMVQGSVPELVLVNLYVELLWDKQI